jgi:hypothetical protein
MSEVLGWRGVSSHSVATGAIPGATTIPSDPTDCVGMLATIPAPPRSVVLKERHLLG